MKDKFIQFLKDHNVLERFKTAYTPLGRTRTLDEHLEFREPQKYIRMAFMWDNEAGGGDPNFWSDLHGKWIELLENQDDQ